MKHQTSKDDQMQARKRAWKSLIIAHEASKAGGPGKRALYHPSPRQEHKAPPGFRELDDFQANALFFGRFCWDVASVALIDKGHLNVAASYLLSTPTWARSCSLAGVTSKVSKLPSVSTTACTLLPLRRLAPS